MNSYIKKVIVKYNDKIVGYFVEIEDNRIAFQYDEQWIQNRFSILSYLKMFMIKVDKQVAKK